LFPLNFLIKDQKRFLFLLNSVRRSNSIILELENINKFMLYSIVKYESLHIGLLAIEISQFYKNIYSMTIKTITTLCFYQ